MTKQAMPKQAAMRQTLAQMPVQTKVPLVPLVEAVFSSQKMVGVFRVTPPNKWVFTPPKNRVYRNIMDFTWI
jgi:hypothetical protein